MEKVRTVAVALALLSSLALADSANAAAQYVVTDLGTLGAPLGSAAYAINDEGQVVGNSVNSAGYRDPFLWTPKTPNGTSGTMQDLGGLGGDAGSADGINNSGQVVGYSLTPSYDQHAFLWTPGGTAGPPGNTQMEDLSAWAGSGSYVKSATGINSSGQITGDVYYLSTGAVISYLWSPTTPNGANGSLQTLGTLSPNASGSLAYGTNNSGQVVGFSPLSPNGTPNPPETPAYLWTPGGTAGPSSNPQMENLGTLTGSGNAVATAVNNDGWITGHSTNSSGETVPFLWKPATPNGTTGEMIDLGSLGGSQSYGYGINDSGQIVGSSTLSNGAPDAFIYQNGSMTDLNTLIPADSGWHLVAATGINRLGQIVGYGIHTGNGSQEGFLLTPVAVPEPSGISLGVLVGCLSLLFRWRLPARSRA